MPYVGWWLFSFIVINSLFLLSIGKDGYFGCKTSPVWYSRTIWLLKWTSSDDSTNRKKNKVVFPLSNDTKLKKHVTRIKSRIFVVDNKQFEMRGLKSASLCCLSDFLDSLWSWSLVLALALKCYIKKSNAS